MIIDSFNNFDKYSILNPNFEKAIEFVKNNNFIAFENGKYIIEEQNSIVKSYIVIAEDDKNVERPNVLEAHRKYIDIQFPISGDLKLVWKNIKDCQKINTNYDFESDLIFFDDIPDFEFTIKNNNFAIIFPQDAHFAIHPDNFIKKAIVKVLV